MLKRRILFAIWCIFVILYYLLSANVASMILIIFTILTSLISFILALLARKNISVSLNGQEIVNKYEKGNIYIEIQNKSYIPVFFGQVELYCRNELTLQEESKTFGFYLGPKESDILEIEVESTRCGRLTYKISSFKCTDLFGVFEVKNSIECVNELLIVPSDVSIENENLEHAMMAENGKTISNEKFGIVEYTPEMSYRLIHWKLSSKLDDMLARADEKKGAVYSSIFIETSINESNKDLYAKIADERLELAYLTSKNMNRLNIGHKFIFYSQDDKSFKEITVSNSDELYKALYILLGIKFIFKDTLSYYEYTPIDTEEVLSVTAYVTDELSYKQEDMADGQGFIPIYKEAKTEYKKEDSSKQV